MKYKPGRNVDIYLPQKEDLEHALGISILILITVNVDIFACIIFRVFMKMGNFTCIKIHVLCIIGS